MIDIPTLAFAGPVARRPAAALEELRAGSPFLREPVVITDAAELMTEVWRWTPEHLRAVIGTEQLGATLPGPDGKFRYDPGRRLESRPLAVSQFFADLADPDGPRWCLQQVPVRQQLPVLGDRLDYPSCVPRELINAVNLWLAAPGTVTPLHYDDTHNLFAQVSGTKTFYLFPPEDLDGLYPGPLNTSTQHVSRIDLFAPDLAKHPRAADLSYRTAAVGAGEALLLPAFWWHQVASHDLSVSVNFWWRPQVLDCLCPGFLRQLQSTTVQEDFGALVQTFELGQDGEDPLQAAAGLIQLLDDLGETKAAVALSVSVLNTLAGRSGTAERAKRLLASEPDARTAADVAALLMEGNRQW